jgi:proline iminopeptidase
MAYAAAHPEHVDKLILSDSAAPAMKNIVRVLPQAFSDMMERSSDPQEQRRNHFRMLFYSEEKRDAYLAGAKDLGYAPQISAAVSRAIAHVDLTAQLAKFAFPTLVITGRYDMNVAPLTAWNIYKAIPGAKFVVFAKSGHLPSYEEPDKYVQVVDAFLGGR